LVPAVSVANKLAPQTSNTLVSSCSVLSPAPPV